MMEESQERGRGDEEKIGEDGKDGEEERRKGKKSRNRVRKQVSYNTKCLQQD